MISKKATQGKDSRRILNDALKVFFKDAVKITLGNPRQALHFFRTVKWQMKGARIRSGWAKQNVPVPPILIFSITNRCNMSCTGCYQQVFHPSTDQELSAEKLKDIAAQAHQLGIYFFVIAGGEPLLRPEILDITQAYPEIIFLLFTNGSLIDGSMVQQFKKQKNVIPLISLEGDLEHTDTRRGEGAYEHVLKTMQKLRKSRVFFGTSISLTRPNLATATSSGFIQELVNIGCKFFLFLDYTPTQVGTEDWVLSDKQRNQIIQLLNSWRKQYPALFIGVPWDEMDVGGCLSAGRGFVHINSEGGVEPCPFSPISDSNLRDVSLKEALQSKFLERLRQSPDLSEYSGGGCALWKNREQVYSLLQDD